jgi:hypothetical protein
VLPADPAGARYRCRDRRDPRSPTTATAVMLFFSNRLGCLGSLLVSAVATLVILLVLGVINLD